MEDRRDSLSGSDSSGGAWSASQTGSSAPLKPGVRLVDPALLQRLDRLRGYRVWTPRDRAVGGDVRALHQEILKRQRQRSGAEGAWAMVLPERLRGFVAGAVFERGVLKVKPTDAVGRSELDRWLRSGGELRVIRASGVPVRKVRLVM